MMPAAKKPRECWSDEAKAEARRMWAGGHSAAKIAAALGKSRNAVIGLTNRDRKAFPYRAAPVSPPKPKPPRRWWTEAERAEARRLRLAGESAVAIGRRLGRNPDDVGAKLRGMGLSAGKAERSLMNTIAARGARPPRSAPLPERAPEPIVSNPVALMERRPCQCAAPAWPDRLSRHEVAALARGGGLMCCGAPVAPDSAYCEAHRRRFFHEPDPRLRRDLTTLADQPADGGADGPRAQKAA